MEDISNFLADNFDIFDIIGSPNDQKDRNRSLIDRLSAKCQYECYNAQHVPVDSYEQLIQFQNQEERLKNPEFAELNAPTKAKFRASDGINCLTEVEFDLQATASTMREYRKQATTSRCSTAYRGELERGSFWPMLWSSQFENNCTEESRVSMNLCQSNVPQDYSIFPNRIIDYNRHDFATTAIPATTKSKSVNLSSCKHVFFSLFLAADKRLYKRRLYPSVRRLARVDRVGKHAFPSGLILAVYPALSCSNKHL